MTPEEEKKQIEIMARLIPAITLFIEDKANEFYENNKDKKEFVLATGVNLLGNLTMMLSEDNVKSKLSLTSFSVKKLMEYYKICLKNYKIQKEAH